MKPREILVLLVAFVLLVLGYSLSLGFYTQNAFFLTLLAFFILIIFEKIAPRVNFKVTNDALLPVFYVVSISFVTITMIFYGGIFQNKNFYYLLSMPLLMFSLILIISSIFSSKKQITKIFILLIIISLTLRVSLILSSPKPKIDVFDTLLIGSKGLLKGNNPYSTIYPKLYRDVIPDYFGYLPGILILSLPFSLIFNDPRYLLALSEIGTGILIFVLVNKSKKFENLAFYISTIFLFSPKVFYMLEQSYIEPTVTFFLALFLFVIQKNYKFYINLFLIGIITSIKQNFWFIPLFVYKQRKKLRDILYILLPSILLIGPFFLWNPKDFYHDVIQNYLYGNPSPSRVLISQHSISIYSYLFHEFNFIEPSWIMFLSVIVFLIFMLLRKTNGLSGLYQELAVWYLGLQLLIRLSFFNHYYFIGNLIILTIVTKIIENPNSNK